MIALQAVGQLTPTTDASSDTPSELDLIGDLGDAVGDSTTTDILGALGILLGAIIIGRIVKTIIVRVLDSGSTDPFIADLLGRLVAYVIVAFGTVYALDQVGVAIGPVLGALGVIGIAVAFALQSILEDFVAGVLLQVRRPFKRGDEIGVLDVTGTILSVDSRTLTVRTPDGETVRLPNSEVIKNPITNLTLRGARRTTVIVGVEYGTDVASASMLIRDRVQALASIRNQPSTEVVAEQFGPSSIDLAVRYWHGASIAEMWNARHEVIVAITEVLAENDITIPFPQQTLHFPVDPASSAKMDSMPDRDPQEED